MAEVKTAEWQPQYESWRHGGWYVVNVRYPSGAVGCVSRNYPDKKWRIVCDERNGDHTYPNRDAAAYAERELAQQQQAEHIAALARDLYPAVPGDGPNHRLGNCAVCGSCVESGQGVEVLTTGMRGVVFLHTHCAEQVYAQQQAGRKS